MGFGHETILDAQRFFHRIAKVLLNLTGRCHAKKPNPTDRHGQDGGDKIVASRKGCRATGMTPLMWVELNSTAVRWYGTVLSMAETVEIAIPDILLKALGANPADLQRKTLEALVVQAYRGAKITHAQVGEILGLNRFETDGFLKTAQAHRSRESEEFASDLENLRAASR